ncbi:hypothetical protein BGW42_003125 [Actinomortierella wolfii]|nr:hypothetical protein BGW42_003125 [Actinomortierella wolfii]
MPQQQQPAHPLLALPKLSLERDREAMTANVASASPTVVTTSTTTTSSSVVTASTAAAAAAAAAGGVLSPPNSSCSGPVPSSSPVHSPTAITSGTSTSVASNTSHALPLSAFSQGGTTPTHATSSLVYVREYHSLETNQEQQPRPAHHWSSTEHYTPSDSYDRMDNSPLGRPPSLTRMRSSSASQHQQHRRIRSSVATHPSPNSISSESMGMLDVPVSTRRRTQSAQYSPSMRLALADPALSKSLQSSPVSSRSSWEHAQQQNAKKRFEANVRRYYHQLVVGCERPLGQCTNRLCRTSLHSPKLTNDAAAILSVQLAARPRLFFCEHCPVNPSIELPQSPLSGSFSTSPSAAILSKSSPSLSRPPPSGSTTKKEALHSQTSTSASTTAATPQPTTTHRASYVRSHPHQHGSGVYPPRRQLSVRTSRPTLMTQSSPSLRQLAEQEADGNYRFLTDTNSLRPPLPPSSSFSSSSSTSSSSRKPFFDSILSLSPFSKIFTSPSDLWPPTPISSPSTINQAHNVFGHQNDVVLDRIHQTDQPTRSHLQVNHDNLLTRSSEPLPRTDEGVERNGRLNRRTRSPPSVKSSKTSQRSQCSQNLPRISSSQNGYQQYRDRIIPLSSSSSSGSSCDEDDEARIQRGTLRRRWPRLYGENRVGLGVFPMSVIGSRPIGDGHGYCPSPLHILSGGRHRSSKSGGRRSRRSKSLVFGSSRDPDSDGSLSSVSRSLSDEDASDVQEVQMKSPPSDTKQEADSTLTQDGPWDGGMDSGVSSDSEDALCLGFMNLQLLRQAIATYNSSRLDDTHMPNLAPSQSEPQLVPPPTRSSGALKSKASAITSTFHYSQSTPSLCRSPSWSTVSSDEDTTLSRRPRRYPGASSPSSSAAAKTKWGQGDSRFLLESIRAVFSSASALGSSFLVSSEASDLELSSTVNVGGIDVGSLREAYEMLIELEPSSLFSIHGTNAIEILLARLELEMLEGGQVAWGDFEMRAIFILLMNPYLFEQPYQESLLNRTLAIFIALPDQDKLVEWISHLDEEGMAQLVTLFKVYLSAHFTPKPKGDHHPAVCAVKALEILYRANEMHIQRIRQVDQAALRSASRDEDPFETTKSTSSTEGLSYKYFYSDVIERLHFKDEYRTWREGLDPSNVDREFSYFAYPFLISPSCKAHIMNLDAMNQMSAFYEEACVRHAMLAQTQRLFSDAISSATTEVQKGIRAITSPYLVLELTRSNIVQETFDQLVAKHADLKKPLKVAFVDVGEEGMDQGGVTKEFFQVMLERVFDSNFGLFKELEETRAWWIEGTLDGSCPVDESDEDVGARLVEYELVGILIGLALYNGVILGVRFPSILYRKLLDWPVDLQSFTDSFPALGQGLRQMLEWSDGDVYDVFMRNFEISYEHMGQVVTLPLIPGGEDIEVTNDERQRYVELYMDHYANVHVSKEFAAFQRGFLKICDGDALKMLRPEELELLLCGNPVLDMHDLELACLYDDGYSAHHELMQDFWDIVHNEMTTEQHKQLLAFVTGSDRVPIRGLRDLVFVIQRNGPDSDRLPTALTCFSRLLLPEYASREKMKERLVTAIENSHGFGLV